MLRLQETVLAGRSKRTESERGILIIQSQTGVVITSFSLSKGLRDQQSETPNEVEVGSEGKDCENNSAKSCIVYNPSMPILIVRVLGKNNHVTDGKWRLAVSLLYYNGVNVSITYES